MKRILLIEPFEHREIIRRWLPALLKRADTVELWGRSTELMNGVFAEGLQSGRFKFSAPDDQQDFTSFLIEKCTSVSAADEVIWLTSALRYDWLNLLPAHINCHLVVHNVQTLLAPRVAWPLSFHQLASLLKYFVSGQDRQRRHFLKRQPTLLFPTEHLQQHAIALDYPSRKTQLVPFAEKQQSKRSLTSQRSIVIPGSVNANTRDYTLVLAAMERLVKEEEQPFELIFLGQCPAALPFFAAFKALATTNPHFRVKFFYEPVVQSEYDRHLAQASLLFLPLREGVSFGPFLEKMGTTKVSGGVFDAIAYNVPLLLPTFYPLPEQLTAKHYRNVTDCSRFIQEIFVGEN